MRYTQSEFTVHTVHFLPDYTRAWESRACYRTSILGLGKAGHATERVYSGLGKQGMLQNEYTRARGAKEGNSTKDMME